MQFFVAFFFFFFSVFSFAQLYPLSSLGQQLFSFFFSPLPLILHPLSDCVASLLNCTLRQLIQSTGFLNDALPCASCTEESGPVPDTSASGSFACSTAAGASADQLAPTQKSGKLTDKKAVVLFFRRAAEVLNSSVQRQSFLDFFPLLPHHSSHRSACGRRLFPFTCSMIQSVPTCK